MVTISQTETARVEPSRATLTPAQDQMNVPSIFQSDYGGEFPSNASQRPQSTEEQDADEPTVYNLQFFQRLIQKLRNEPRMRQPGYRKKRRTIREELSSSLFGQDSAMGPTSSTSSCRSSLKLPADEDHKKGVRSDNECAQEDSRRQPPTRQVFTALSIRPSCPPNGKVHFPAGLRGGSAARLPPKKRKLPLDVLSKPAGGIFLRLHEFNSGCRMN
eukprot:CAMPEP_0168620828 /NCGR_PEP_ID=MMETSP0449_2-20121227/7357_1 /TAXON_ID=1082188 /ORGANISM="Strombidium rassoulzadegani, Strain ras09" /LENGTH=215 /DNA_ID=CAMNT_0008661883 /DNA_START=551 /DNA_END=1200 /DNA_ORIENTATION=+